MANVVTIASEHRKVGEIVVVLIAVLMMYDVLRPQVKVLPYNLTGQSATVLILDERRTVPGCKPSVVTVGTAKVVKVFPQLSTMPFEHLAASNARGVIDLSTFDTGRNNHLIDPLPGDAVLFGKLNHGDQPR